VTALSATAELPPPQHDPEEVRRLAHEILARREFAPPRRSVVERVLGWLGDRLGDLFDRFRPGSPGGAGTGGSNLVSAVVLLAAAAGAVALVWVLWRQRGRIRRRPATDDVDVEVTERRSVSAWEAEAARLEAAGEWKPALRARFRALVERLAGDGVVPDVPGRTSGEYRLDVRVARPEGADDFARAAELFERAWYGDLPTGPGEAAEFAEHADRVLAPGGRR
jgi:hypothetical protein